VPLWFRADQGIAGTAYWLITSHFQPWGEVIQNSGHYAVQGHSRSPLSVGANRKPVCDCLRLNNTNLLIFCRDQDIAESWYNFHCRQEVPLFNILVPVEPLNLLLRNLASRNKRHYSMVWCKACFDILNPLTVTRFEPCRCDSRV